MHDIVMVNGVEKMTSQTTAKVAEILAGAGDTTGEVKAGATFPALFAMVARRHMFQYGTTREDLAAVAVKNHAAGAKNDYAHMRKVITMEQALAGKPVADPLTVYDCSLVSDGAADRTGRVVLRGRGGDGQAACRGASADHGKHAQRAAGSKHTLAEFLGCHSMQSLL